MKVIVESGGNTNPKVKKGRRGALARPEQNADYLKQLGQTSVNRAEAILERERKVSEQLDASTQTAAQEATERDMQEVSSITSSPPTNVDASEQSIAAIEETEIVPIAVKEETLKASFSRGPGAAPSTLEDVRHKEKASKFEKPKRQKKDKKVTQSRNSEENEEFVESVTKTEADEVRSKRVEQPPAAEDDVDMFDVEVLTPSNVPRNILYFILLIGSIAGMVVMGYVLANQAFIQSVAKAGFGG